jgi:hypothetical protein
VIEKPNAVMIGLERSTGGAPITQPDQIRAHLLFAQFVRRPPVVGCQPANRLDVNLLAPGCQPRQVHVLDHSASQWGHRHLPSFQDRLGPTGPTGRRDTLNCSNQRCRAPPRRSRSVQYREFQRFGAWRRVNGSKNEDKISALWANSLGVRTGNFLRYCREFKSPIRGIYAAIRESSVRGCAQHCWQHSAQIEFADHIAGVVIPAATELGHEGPRAIAVRGSYQPTSLAETPRPSHRRWRARNCFGLHASRRVGDASPIPLGWIRCVPPSAAFAGLPRAASSTRSAGVSARLPKP